MSITQQQKLNLIWKYAPYLAGVNIYDPALGIQPNGCGPADWKNPMLVDLLNKIPGIGDIDWVGDLHDALYALGGTLFDFTFANCQLFDMLQDHVVKVKWWNPLTWLNETRMELRADAYFLAVREGGAAHFTWRELTTDVRRFQNPCKDVLRVLALPIIPEPKG